MRKRAAYRAGPAALPRAYGVLIAAVVLLAIPAIAQESTPEPKPTKNLTPIHARALNLSSEDPSLDHVGLLSFLGGLHLTSSDDRFGGISALTFFDDGRLLMLNDQARWFAAEVQESGGRLTGIGTAKTVWIHTGPDLTFRSEWRDSEALARIPDGSGYFVSYELTHRIERFGKRLKKGQPFLTFSPVPKLEDNGGIEALTLLPDGRLLAIEEGDPAVRDMHRVWLIDGTNRGVLGYQGRGKFQPTDVALLPDGDLLLLSRRFNLLDGVAARLERIAAEDIASGAVITGEEIATLRPPLNVDNMEGLTVREENGRTRIYLVSDDNFNAFQRTLLMKFELTPSSARQP